MRAKVRFTKMMGHATVAKAGCGQGLTQVVRYDSRAQHLMGL